MSTRSGPVVAGVLLAASAAGAQTARDTTAADSVAAARRLPTVRVEVTRETSRSPLELPFAVTSVRPDTARPGQRHLSLDEQLLLLPGVTVANRSNPSQDPRISIRGFGSRSAFGVRGVRVLRDGMPLTLPDGQTPVDYMDLESVGRIEVIRGAASALYGNASGGVIDLRTVEPPAGRVAAQLRGILQKSAGTGSMLEGGDLVIPREDRQFGRWSAMVGGRSAGSRLRYQANVARNDGEGYRDYARQRLTSGFGRAVVRAAGTDIALTTLLLDMPLAENPGALTLAEMRSDPRSADPLSVARRARKEVTQGQVGLSASRQAGRGGDLFALAYGGWRSLYNPLTFNVVDVGRTTAGASLRGTSVPVALFGVTHRLSAGVDYQRQDDDRKNFNACNGRTAGTPPAGCTIPVTNERGAVTLDQRELIQSLGPFVRDELALGDRVRLSVGGRADVIKFRVEDHLISGTNPDDSGDRTMRAFSPAVGVVTRLSLLHALYANVSSAFETPTTTELGNQEDGSAGLNRALKPQYSTTYELGLKGLVLGRVQYDVAGFVTPVRDELIQFTAASGRTFYRNAGRTRRRGFEGGLTTAAGPLEATVSYSYSDFTFDEYRKGTADLSGKRIPGIPRSLLQGALTYRWRSAFATAEAIGAASAFVNDENTARAAGYEVLNLRAGASSLFGRPAVSPFIGLQNVFNRAYAPSVAINAAPRAGETPRYYEPAPGRQVYVGLSVGVGR